MKIASFFSHHLLRSSMVKRGKIPEFALQIDKIRDHLLLYPTPQKTTQIEINLSSLRHHKLINNLESLKKTPEYKQLAVDSLQRTQKKFAKIERQNAYTIQQSYTANGGTFSYAQQLANRSGSNVIGVKGEYIKATAGNNQQYLLFRPQPKLLGLISNLGNYFLSKW
ncbi:hypothetical protein [Providencia vermicola]|uniref:hypothetical protein n=1 Tax=Providencia vermicola TaxID=333965 RepID=UPI0022008369|nr:hypothetical protein NFC79_18325 [Providencia stuartii]